MVVTIYHLFSSSTQEVIFVSAVFIVRTIGTLGTTDGSVLLLP